VIEQEEQVPEDPQEREARDRQDYQDDKDLIEQDDEQQDMIEQEPECSSTNRFPVRGSGEAEEDTLHGKCPKYRDGKARGLYGCRIVDRDSDSDNDGVLRICIIAAIGMLTLFCNLSAIAVVLL
jgi:hypothetical protein